MSNPPPYVPSFSFSGFQETNPTDPPPGPMLDNEFADIADSVNTAITALSSVRRSDGALANGIVTPDSLSSGLIIGVQTPTAWITAVAYTAGNIVVQSNKFYLCLVAHTSGVFATDLAAVKWVEVTLSITGYSADQITYDHTVSGLTAVNVKAALDEIDADLDVIQAQALTVNAQVLTPAQQGVARANISAGLKGRILGLTLTNNSGDASNDIDIAAGEAASTETDPVLMVLAATLTKRLDAAWAVGTGNGGLDTGAVANSTYYVWLIRRSDTGVVDALFSLSATAPTMPASYDQKRVIGQFVRTAGVNSTTLNAPPGAVGEIISSNVPSSSFVTLVTSVAKTVTSIFLTAGDWDVYGNVGLSTGATTSVTFLAQSISLVNNTQDITEGRYAADAFAAVVYGAVDNKKVMSPIAVRLSLQAATTIYLVATSIFTVAANSAYGALWARRVR